MASVIPFLILVDAHLYQINNNIIIVFQNADKPLTPFSGREESRPYESINCVGMAFLPSATTESA
jgi:hypothetical protein